MECNLLCVIEWWCAQREFDLKSQVWFQTKIARHEVQLPSYYIHFEITFYNQEIMTNTNFNNYFLHVYFRKIKTTYSYLTISINKEGHYQKGLKISSSAFWREESCNKNCKLFYLNLCHLCFLYFAARTCQNFHSFLNFYRLCSRLCCVVIGCLSFFCFVIGCSKQYDYIFKQCDYRLKTVGLETQTVRLQLNSCFREPTRMQESPVISKWI